MKKGILILSLSFFALQVLAQGSIKGTVLDSIERKPLALATVTVFNAADTSVVSYRLSNPKGEFKVPGIPLGVESRVVISFSGFAVYRKTFTLRADQNELDLDSIFLPPTAASLDEVLVVSERPPVIVRQDTIEFNANSFKTLPTALVEDLLRKLPGVEIDEEGNILFNGRKVNRIMVDGKDFFGGDPKMATRNLPANIIDRIQVSEDSEEADRNPDLAKSQLGQVINLKLKREIKKGLFGKLYAGGGTDDRYEAGGIINTFRDTLQVSVLGYGNNLNRAGFSMQDVMQMGGFDRGGINSININSDGGFALDGISFGGMGSGIQRSAGGGANLNTELGKKLSLNLRYFYGNIRSDLAQNTRTRQFFADTILTSLTDAVQRQDQQQQQIGGQLKWTIDSMTTLNYRPSISIGETDTRRQFQTFTDNNFLGVLNRGENQMTGRNSQNGYNHSIYLNRKFKRKGQTLTIYNSLGTGSEQIDEITEARNIFYQNSIDTSRLQQLRKNEKSSVDGFLSINYLHPLSEHWGIRLYQTNAYFNNRYFLNTFNPDGSKEYVIPNDSLSDGIRRSGWRNNSRIGVKYSFEKFSITPSINFQWFTVDNYFERLSALHQEYRYWLPSLEMQVADIRFNYSIAVQEPNINDLQPVVNNTNPLYQQLGNPGLQPGLQHSFSVSTFKFNMSKGLSYNIYIQGGIGRNTVVRERYIDDKGVQVTRPINVRNGDQNASIFWNVTKQYKFSKDWKLSVRGRLYVQMDRRVLLVNNNQSYSRGLSGGPGVTFDFNWKDIFQIQPEYGLNYSQTHYDNSYFTNINVVTHSVKSKFTLRVPKHFVWESDLDYFYNPVTIPGFSQSRTRWNGGLTWLFLKQDKGSLKFYVYDILNQNRGINRTTKENYIRDEETVVLKRYFLLSFSYTIRDFSPERKSKSGIFFF